MTDQLAIEGWRLLAYCLISAFTGAAVMIGFLFAWQWLTDLDDDKEPTKISMEVPE